MLTAIQVFSFKLAVLVKRYWHSTGHA